MLVMAGVMAGMPIASGEGTQEETIVVEGDKLNVSSNDSFYGTVVNITFVNLTADSPYALINPAMEVVAVNHTNSSGFARFENITINQTGTWWVHVLDPVVARLVRKPEKPNGPSSLRRYQSGTYKTIISRSQLGDEITGAIDYVRYGWDWNGDHSVDKWTNYMLSYNPPPTVSLNKIGETIESNSWSSSGVYYIRVKAQNLAGLESDWSESKTVTIWENYAIIVRGGIVNDVPNFNGEANKAYTTLTSIGYSPDRVYYLNVDTTQSGVDSIATRANVEGAITTWLKSRSTSTDRCFIYLTGHGSDGGFFYLDSNGDGDTSDPGDNIRDFELDGWINQVIYQVCTVFVDSCYSGDFIDDLSATNRIVITSADGSHTSRNEVFTYPFFDTLKKGYSIGKAWEAGDADAANRNPSQNPQIDDNGDGVGHGTTSANTLPISGDGNLALTTYP